MPATVTSRRPTARLSPSDEPLKIPTRSWKSVIARVDSLWKLDIAPHHSLMGQNGSGKSYIIVNGILPLCTDDNVLIIDNKGDDPVLASSGAKAVRKVPAKRARGLFHNSNQPKDNWFRLVVHEDVHQAQDQVAEALNLVYKEGEWIVVLDETRAIADPRSPGLGLQPLLDRLWLRGRSRKIAVVASTQAPRWVPSSFYDQCQFVWCSRIRDERAHQRVMEIGSMTRQHIPVIASVRKRRWIYMDDEEDETWVAETGL
jgi:hypothetical protein